LVEWQLLAAAGEKLPLTQNDIRLHGHAIEARITAERADRDFQPATGRLTAVVPPRGLRFDSGVTEGSEIGLYYDSLLAKLIAHGAARESALARLASGLEGLTLLGVATTQPFLRDAVRHPLFAGGKATTRFIETAFPEKWTPDAAELTMLRATAAALWLREDDETPGFTSPWVRRSAVRVTAAVRPASVALHLSDDYGDSDVTITVDRDGTHAEIDGNTVSLGADIEATFVAQRDGDTIHIARNGLTISAKIALKIDLPRGHGTHDRGGNVIEAPLHGVVSQINVAVGDAVEKGSAIMQMEAMKLIHTLTAPVSGRIATIHCKAGDTVPAGALLVEITPDAEEGT
jgi:3-methylcrotonyl-CoA carboxylase alpha subunit